MPYRTFISTACLAALLLICLSAPAGAEDLSLLAAAPKSESETTAKGRHIDSPKDLDPQFVDMWSSYRPGFKKREFDHPAELTAPLESGSNNGFHHLLLLPPMEQFRLLAAGKFSFSMGLGHTYAADAAIVPGNRFKASFTELRTRVGMGLGKRLELRAGFNLARFSFNNEEDVQATQEGIAVFPPQGFSPGLGVGDITLGLKFGVLDEEKYDIGIAAVLTLKIPVGKNDFLTSGRGDVAMAFMGTYKLSLVGGFRVYFHLNAGWAFFDEENVFEPKVYVNSASFYGLSIVVPFGPKLSDPDFEDGFNWAVLLQCQGHENAFAKFDQFNSSPASVHGGLRARFGEWVVEGGVGFGVTDQGSGDYTIDFKAVRRF